MRKLSVLCIGLLGLTLLVGCGNGDDANKSAPPMPGRSDYASATVAPAPATVPGLREQGPVRKDNNTGGETVTARKEVVTGSVDLTADKPVEAAGKIVDRVRDVGGRVDSRTEQPGSDDSDAGATLTVRVPADKTDRFVDGLGGIGKVTRVSTNRDDVTMQWEDLDARIKALQTSVDRLRALIAGATNTADLINAEQALSSRQGELDSLTAQKKHLDDEVSLSTLTIDVTTTTKKADQGPDSFWDGIVAGWHSLVNWLKDAVVFTGKALPWLGFLAVLGAAVWAVVRFVVRRTKGGGSTGTGSGTGGSGGPMPPIGSGAASGPAPQPAGAEKPVGAGTATSSES
ncbi:DUF4349 domain-containing protein [Nocardia altamirensis]|uniref:DUF4349 domain-containing protein n=1 Tax=Nocardia altamirensis TaxID=472158 RepID=UPI000A00F1EE|nr:DUF4349 domain-containing protein [Nocardia altamirensis]